ncbi:hypothetical protein EYZ11_003731 [Aspergillus tanneri]|uniref:Uncharacterized protein n=1 Tax=Aspergillus tanneri TaxID=1220188 RepID=A0A4S3JMH7_9EURO|nr:hypothetical protein EYZ11_003731 [Aspergillus tanneri]
MICALAYLKPLFTEAQKQMGEGADIDEAAMIKKLAELTLCELLGLRESRLPLADPSIGWT